MKEESFRYYKVIETKDMSAEELQEVLNNATDDFPEKQIDYVVGTKIILGYESMLNSKGRAESRAKKAIGSIKKSVMSNKISGGFAND